MADKENMHEEEMTNLKENYNRMIETVRLKIFMKRTDDLCIIGLAKFSLVTVIITL